MTADLSKSMSETYIGPFGRILPRPDAARSRSPSRERDPDSPCGEPEVPPSSSSPGLTHSHLPPPPASHHQQRQPHLQHQLPLSHLTAQSQYPLIPSRSSSSISSGLTPASTSSSMSHPLERIPKTLAFGSDSQFPRSTTEPYGSTTTMHHPVEHRSPGSIFNHPRSSQSSALHSRSLQHGSAQLPSVNQILPGSPAASAHTPRLSHLYGHSPPISQPTPTTEFHPKGFGIHHIPDSEDDFPPKREAPSTPSLARESIETGSRGINARTTDPSRSTQLLSLSLGQARGPSSHSPPSLHRDGVPVMQYHNGQMPYHSQPFASAQAHAQRSTNSHSPDRYQPLTHNQNSGSKEPVSKPNPRLVEERWVEGEGMCYFYEDGTRCRKVIDGEEVNANWGVTKAGKPRKRLAQACITCREKKIKCEPSLPKCVQCTKFGRECRFESASVLVSIVVEA